MSRLTLCAALVLGLAGLAQAHFVFVVPDKDGNSAKVVFSDSLDADENVPISKIFATKLYVRAGDGKPAKLDWKEGKHALETSLAGKGFRVVQGTTDYGVLTKGKDTFALRYHPRAVIGRPTEAMKPDEALPVEILPVFADGKLKFLVAAKGKAVADAEVTVMPPEGKSVKAKTDRNGLTEAHDAAGRYGAWVRQSEATSGEQDGKKYAEVRHYATLVVDLGR